MDSRPDPTPDPARVALLRTACRPLPLEEVAEHVAAVSSPTRKVYVERRRDGYRWSIAHGGGPYPLLRTVAAFLQVDHTRIVVEGRDAGDGWCVFQLGPRDDGEPDAWAVLALAGEITPVQATEEILRALAR